MTWSRNKLNGQSKTLPVYILNQKKYKIIYLLVWLVIVWQGALLWMLLQLPSDHEISHPVRVSVARKEEESIWEGMKILCFMTTHLSQQHINALKNCWSKALNDVPMLRNSNLLIYSSCEHEGCTETILGKDSDLMKNVLSEFRSVRIEVPSRGDILEQVEIGAPMYGMKPDEWKKMLGAELAVKHGFAKGWFNDYDWVYRVNPDVIIRDDKFFEDAFRNDTVDGVFVECAPLWIHTDFFAFRPHAMSPDSFQFNREYKCAERQAFQEFHHILDTGRFQWLKGARPERLGYCRVAGAQSPVIHNHEFVDVECPNIQGHDEYYANY